MRTRNRRRGRQRAATGLTREGDRLLCAMLLRTAGPLGALALLMVMAIVGSLLLPRAIGDATDAVLAGHQPGGALMLVAACAALTVLAEGLAGFTVMYATTAAARWLRRRTYRRLLAAGITPESRFGGGELAGRITAGSQAASVLGPAVLGGAGNTVITVGGLVALGLIDPRLVAVFLVGVPAAFLISRTFLRSGNPAAAAYLQAQVELAGRLVEALRGLRSIRAGGKVGHEIDRVLAPLPRLHAAGLRTWSAQGRAARQTGLLFPLLELAVLTMAGLELSAGRLAPGQMLSVAGYAALGIGLGNQTALLSQFAQSRAGAHRLAEILTIPIQPGPGRALPYGPGVLRLDDVTVFFDARPVIRHVSASLSAGSLTVVVGRSGSGKSTLAAVAAGLVRPSRGRALLDGEDLGEVGPAARAAAVACAFERPVLIGDTIADALALGCERTGPDALAYGARAAAIADFIARLPGGYRAPLARTSLSGGEAQRIGLARALCRPSRLLVLDDATSSVDPATEARIMHALDRLPGHPTRLVVTHRAAVAARADQVLWLEEGRLAGMGTHRQLWADRGYREVFETPRGKADSRPSADETGPAA